MFVEDFEMHILHMRYFHQRWMPSERAKQNWLERVRELDIEMFAPQHGRVFRGDDVKRFLDWFEGLPLGIAVDT
jgi:flavorubredoxin